MKQIPQLLVVIIVLLSFTVCHAQSKNSETDPSDSKLAQQTVKVFGNCEMCKTTIEKAGSLKKTAKVDWNADTKMATLTYDSKKISQDEILKRIALSGYDSEKFLAPDAIYSKLPSCCQYDREAKVSVKTESKTEIVAENHINDENHSETTTVKVKELIDSEQEKQTNQLKAVFDNYFKVKNALVKTDGNTASTKAAALLAAINAVKMDMLSTDEHFVWMKVLKTIKEDTANIANTKDAKKQRDHFDTLSLNTYALMKVSKQETPTYYQFCPMANNGKGANWLSKENTIKNPYYGSMMLSCGKVVETIQ
jgi:copper chaperone CopZ